MQTSLQNHIVLLKRAAPGKPPGEQLRGNITAGVDYMRRVDGSLGHGLVWPLLLKPDGEKFGKTAEGNVWLCPRRTSPFRFHQFWLNSDDALVDTLLLRFTARSLTEVDRLMTEHRRDPGMRAAQRALAREVTEWVHGKDAAESVEQAAELLFDGHSASPSPAALKTLEAELGSLRLTREELSVLPTDQLVARAGLCRSTSEARRQIAAGGIYLDGERLTDPGPLPAAAGERSWLLLRRGRRHHALVRLT